MLQALLIEGEHRTQIEWPRELQRWVESDGILWLDLQGPVPAEVEELGRQFALHPTVVRACTHPEHRARIREFREHFLLVLNAVGRGVSENGNPADIGRWRTLELNVVIGRRFMLTVHPENVPAVSALFQRLVKAGEGRATIEYLLYSLCEAVATGYYVVLDRIDRLVDHAETMIFKGDANQPVVDQLFRLKRHILYLRRVLAPQRDAIGALMRRELPELSAEAGRAYFVDIYEHTLRLVDLLDTYRDLISSSLDAHLSITSNRMNEVMKTLTIVSTLMLPLTLVTGIFGMNVAGLPLATTPAGFAAVMLLMAAMGAVMWYYFKRRGWM
jgi:magnesium transporter